MGSDFFRQPSKRLEREFRALGGRVLERSVAGVRYEFPDGGVHLIPEGVTPGKARAILTSVQDRYQSQTITSRTDPLRSAEKRDGAPTIDPATITMSRHATGRLELMTTQARLHRSEVDDALVYPEKVLWSPIHESWMWVRGRVIVAVGTNEFGITIIRTIMWATEALWEQNPRPTKES